MARQIRSSLGGLNGVAAQAGKGLEALTGRYAAGLAGLGVSYKAAQAVMDSARLDKGLMRTSQTMGLTAQQAVDARRELFAMAQRTGQPIEKLKAGLDDLGASGMEYAQALESIKAINPAMAVTGASGEQLASALSVAFAGSFGGEGNRHPIPLGSSEPDTSWVLCDGGSDGKGGTVPNLLGRMIRGASDSVPAGSTGGSETHSHSLSGTVGDTTLTETQLASHKHTVRGTGNASGGFGGGGTGIWEATATTSAVGGSQPHTHTLDGASGEASSLPPYYVLSYVMRCA